MRDDNSVYLNIGIYNPANGMSVSISTMPLKYKPIVEIISDADDLSHLFDRAEVTIYASIWSKNGGYGFSEILKIDRNGKWWIPIGLMEKRFSKFLEPEEVDSNITIQ